MMDQLIQKFPQQLKDGLDIAAMSNITSHAFPINKVIVAGMGGSGIGGDFVSQIGKEECSVPYIVNKSYEMPGFVDENTLVIISSYSGNTEESEQFLTSALSTKAKIVCITSGGKIMDLAIKEGLNYITLPSGWPSPRACLGFSIIQQLNVLVKLGLIKSGFLDQIRSSIDLLKFEQDEIKKKAKVIAEQLVNKQIVIYSTDRIESVALRLRQQLNENSKVLCWHHTIPEMNHNELVGWYEKNDQYAAIFFRNKDDYRKNITRMDITKSIIAQKTATIIEIYSKGQSLIEKMIYLVHLSDWISWYLSQLKKVDASEIKVIDFLKAELNKIVI